MLVLGSRLIDTPVMSLQTGTELARTKRAIIDPSTLTIVAYEVTNPSSQTPLLLRLNDVRELSSVGFIIDSSDEFVAPNDVIKLHDIYQLGFVLDKIAVKSERGKKLGRVMDYTIDSSTFTVIQLNVKRPLLQSLTDSELMISRQQIVEVTGDSITVREAASSRAAPVQQKTGYINPFRKQTTPAPQAIETDS